MLTTNDIIKSRHYEELIEAEYIFRTRSYQNANFEALVHNFPIIKAYTLYIKTNISMAFILWLGFGYTFKFRYKFQYLKP